MSTLLEIKDLKISFFNHAKSAGTQVIRGFDLSVESGEIVGILGESGSGKTVSSTAILRLLSPEESSVDSGEIWYGGMDLNKQSERRLKRIRGRRIGYVFQTPAQALNPYQKIGKQLKNTMKAHGLKAEKPEILKALEEVGISQAKTVYHMYPHQLSGGQNQRIMVAQTVLCKPDLLIADEPTSSIDASLKRKILDLFAEINKKYHMSIIIITHDFDIIKYLCHRVVVMYGGLVMETGKADDVLDHPLHPYTEELKKCAESLDGEADVLYSLDGSPPTPLDFKDQCPFYERCKYQQRLCQLRIPEMRHEDGRSARCVVTVVSRRLARIKAERKQDGWKI